MYDHGWLRATTRGDSLTLFEGPLEAGRADIAAGRLPDGAEVVVMEIHALESDLELRVRPVDRLEPFGWIVAGSVSPFPPPAPKTSPPRGEGPPTDWSIQLAIGGGWVLNTELDEEYGDGGFHVEAAYQRYPAGAPHALWMWSAGLGYWDYKGNPQVNYVNEAQIDEPWNSTLRLGSIWLEGGQRLGSWVGLRGSWSLGPALYYLHESALVRTYTASTMTLIGTRTETLGRVAGGGRARIGLGWRFEPGFEVGMQIDGFLMAWNGQREKSLTTDFIHGSIGGIDFGLTLTYPAP